jgi:DNA-binding GntR family transcriptional regulator
MPAQTKRAPSGAPAKPRPLAPVKSLAERAADEIRTMITNGDLPSGEALSEMALAAQLGVSKTPVREAFLRLKEEGLVEISPRRGTYVFEMSREQATDLSRFRFVLERSALKGLNAAGRTALVAQHTKLLARMERAIVAGDGPGYRILDTNYHLAIVRSNGNSFLVEAYDRIAWLVQALLSRLLKDPRLNEISFLEHTKLTNLIGDGRINEAARLLEGHILDAEKRYKSIVSTGRNAV